MKKITALLLVCLFWFHPTPVLAQEATDSGEVSAQQAAIVQKQRLDDEINQLQTIYRGQLAEYRTAEKNFSIAKDQYEQLGTLASINQVTEAARSVMKLRDQVLLTYYELLRVNLVAEEGVELSLKDAMMPFLTEQTSWLQDHLQRVTNASDREQFNQLGDEFAAREESLRSVAAQAASLLSIGRLQNVFDRLQLISADLQTEAGTGSAVVQSREMRETERLTSAVRENFLTVWQDLRSAIEEKNASGFANNLADKLNPVYANLTKLSSYLEELLKQL